MINRNFRTDPASGLVFHEQGEKLIRWNAVAGVVSLLVGGVLALLVILTRWPAVHLLPADWFYLVLTAHGVDMLIVWIIFFEIAVLYFCATVLLRCRLAAPRWAWAGFWLMIIGALVNNVAVFRGDSSVMFTSYVPMGAHPAFYLGLILFAVGALIGCFVFFGTLVVAKAERTYNGSLPLVTFGAVTAAIIAVFTIASGAIILIPTFLWSIGLVPSIDSLMYRTVWWAFGHSSQQINVAAHVSVWYLIAAIVFGAKPMSEKVSRGAFLLYIFFLQLASAHHLLADPGLTSHWKIFNTSYAMYLAVLASMVHGLTVPGAIEVAQRKKGFDRGLFEWLRKAPWGDPGFSSLVLSVVVFGFVGGITGVTIGTEQINIIVHNTLRVPGHFHATVVSGTAMAFMGATYYLIPLLFQKRVAFWKIAKLQPYIFAGGMFIFTISMTFAGNFGVPRRHWDITFSQAPYSVPFNPIVDLMLAFVALGGLLAATGAILFVAIAVKSVFFGTPVGQFTRGVEAVGLPRGITHPPVHAADVDARNAELHSAARGIMGPAPGTIVLVFVFLAVFALYFFTNWKILSFLWRIG